MLKRLTGDQNQCPSCGKFFRSVSAFDKHREGQIGVDRRCLNENEMLSKGMVKRADGFWRGSEMPAGRVWA